MTTPALRVGVVQDGARRHYQVPVALHRAGLLDRVFTDWYAAPGSAARAVGHLLARVRPGLGRRVLERHCPELDGVPVLPAAVPFLVSRCTRWGYRTEESFFSATADRFASWLLRGHRLKGLDVLFGMVRNLHPKVAPAVHRNGGRVLADQMIAPAATEGEVHRLEAERWPGWEPAPVPRGFDLVDRLERETWATADHLTCGSEYVKQSLLQQGVAAEKVTVVPYTGVPAPLPPDRGGRTGPVMVGFVGSVGLRKGAPYFLNVARRFDPAKVRFVMVGPVTIDPAVVQRERGAVELVGRVPRSAVVDWLTRFDVLYFPTTCEGSAGAVIEALGTGLPVVTSPNSGSTVRDGIEGFIARYDDVDRAAECINRLVRNPELRATMGAAAYSRHAVHHPARYAAALADMIHRMTGRVT